MSWTVDPNHTQVEFSAKHMGIMTVKGHITGVQATIDFNEDDFTASSVAATIDPGTLTTNDERRDAHLKSAGLPQRRAIPDDRLQEHPHRACGSRPVQDDGRPDYPRRYAASQP